MTTLVPRASALLALAAAAATALASCGSDPNHISSSKAETLIGAMTGYDVACADIGLPSGIPEDSFPTDQLWQCEGGKPRKKQCWTTRLHPQQNGRAEVFAPDSLDNHAGYEPECPESVPDADTPPPTPETPDDTAPPVDEFPDDTPEDDLATIQLGHRPDADDSTLLRITYLLDRMQTECPANTRRQLADFTANVMKQLEAVGVAATPQEILTDVRQSSSLQEFDDCLDLFALYTILRKEQG